MGIEIVFGTHSTTGNNEAGRATGWLPCRLSEQGRAQARELGRWRARDGIAAVFCSDLRRAVQTAELATLRPPAANRPVRRVHCRPTG